jgi:ABC-type transporter Mla subunit MlaD
MSFQKLAEHQADLDKALAVAVRMMRDAADDPDAVEPELREHLRSAARLVEQMGKGHETMVEVARRMSLRFGVVGFMFLSMAAWNVALMVFH